MHLSRLLLNPLNRSVQRDLADCQDLHRTILRAFPPLPPGENPRDHYAVLHRVEIHPKTGTPAILVQSRIKPDWQFLCEQGDYLLPNAEDINPDYKSLETAFKAIQENCVYRFRLRANPTFKHVIRDESGERKKNGRREPIRDEAGHIEWLRRKGEAGGFQLVAVKAKAEAPDILDVVTRPDAVRRWIAGTNGAQRMTFSSIQFDGRLRVVDCEQFRQTLIQGVGSAKAYGFGLLSIAKL